ncbi:STAGA complex 65 subunit gamma isoform X1 [Centruroides vittatus]|uniref:STAGA complex 65 subunit gamma isoform X1 n=2 Tax=Centruroides vittatus TaxID=120091 RepID=UPI00350E9969
MLKSNWGDLPMIPDTESGIAAIEREQITKPRPVAVEGMKLHHPSRNEPVMSHPLPAECSSIDDLTLHTIKLIQYNKKIKTMLNTLHSDSQKSVEDGNHTYPAVPPMPELPESVMVHYMKREIASDRESDFVYGRGKSPPELSFPIMRQILRKSVAAICAHIGFDSATDTVLETLTDIAHEHNLRICRLLRMGVDRQTLTGHTGFIDVIEQVFHEAGIGSITTLHNFYQSRMIDYHKFLFQTCQQLLEEYERLRTPEMKTDLSSKPIKIKDEPMSEINFPVNEEIEESAMDEPHTPLQLEELPSALQTLETEGSATMKDEENMKWPGQNVKKEGSESTPNLDPDDEIDGSDSPTSSMVSDIDISSQGINSIGVTDISPGIECTRIGKPPKKKRKKM